MTTPTLDEIISQLKAGNVRLAEQVGKLMATVERLEAANRRLMAELERAQAGDQDYYCPEHKYNPPPNSGFAFCPHCEGEE